MTCRGEHLAASKLCTVATAAFLHAHRQIPDSTGGCLIMHIGRVTHQLHAIYIIVPLECRECKEVWLDVREV
jgi:hypothetical protein